MKQIRSGRLLVLAFAASLAASAPALAVIVPSGPFPNIQSAINAVRSGQLPSGTEIQLQNGTYKENLQIQDTAASMKIVGLGGSAVAKIDGGNQATTTVLINKATGNVVFEGVTILGGSGLNACGAPCGGGVFISQSSPTFNNVVISGNNALSNGSGGGVFVGNGSKPIFNGSTIQNNTAGRQGGGIFANNNSVVTLISGTIKGNRSGVNNNTDGAGGGMFLTDGATANVGGTEFLNNNAAVAGGAFEFINTVAPKKTMTISNCRINGNTATTGTLALGQGGGFHVEDFAVVQMDRCSVTNNTAEQGGGISNFRGTLNITNSVISGNTATSNDPTGGEGGGIAIFTNGGLAPSLSLGDTAVQGNHASGNGAAGLGGGIYAQGLSGLAAVVTVNDNSMIGDNDSLNGGGGIFGDFAAISISDTQIVRNLQTQNATGGGGGIQINNVSSLTVVNNSVIADNRGRRFGGGILAVNRPTLVVENSFIHHNDLSIDPPDCSGTVAQSGLGGGIYIDTPGGSDVAQGHVTNTFIGDNTHFQLGERDRNDSGITYGGNHITTTGGTVNSNGSGDHAVCPNGVYINLAPFTASADVATFQSGTGVGGRASGNDATLPNLISFKATPREPIPSFLSWSVTRATAINIGNVGPMPPSKVPSGTQPVSGPCTVFNLTGSRSGTPFAGALLAPFTQACTLAAITGAGPGGSPQVRLFRVEGGVAKDYVSFFPYEQSFGGGVSAAGARPTGKTPLLLVTAPGPGGGPHVRIWDVTNLGPPKELSGFFPYAASFTGGVALAIADVNGDGSPDLVTAPLSGGPPRIRVFSLANPTSPVAIDGGGGFLAYDAGFGGGVHIAVADLDGDGRAEIMTAPAGGGGPNVRVFTPAPSGGGNVSFTLKGNFFAYDPNFTGGVFLAAGDIDNDGKPEVITAPGQGGAAQIRIWEANAALSLVDDGNNFLAYPASFTGGARLAVGAGEENRNILDIVTGAGPGSSQVKFFRIPGDGAAPNSPKPVFDAYPGFAGGVFLGGYPGP